MHCMLVQCSTVQLGSVKFNEVKSSAVEASAVEASAAVQPGTVGISSDILEEPQKFQWSQESGSHYRM